MDIKNTKVYGLGESIVRSGYPMLAVISDEKTFNETCNSVRGCIEQGLYSNKHIKRAISLANSGVGHSNFLKSIIVQMDVEAPQYVWMQIERYQFFTIISSQSKMHRLTEMDVSDIPNVGYDVIDLLEENIRDFKSKKIDIDELMAEVPMGLELTAGISTNYMCLKNMYHQRKNHRLKFWTTIFCPWIESLPMAKELIIGECTRN